MKSIIIYFATALISVSVISSISAQTRKLKKIEYRVVINHEEQYSIWPVTDDIPDGWIDTGIQGVQRKCQQQIRKLWTDMRPLSIRKMNLPKDTRYVVVINHEEQYSVWPTKMDTPANWKKTAISGTLSEVTDYIEEVWTDMRPLSIRKRSMNEKD